MNTALLGQVLSSDLPIWTILVVSSVAALGPVVFQAIWRKIHGIEHAETGKLNAETASKTVDGAASLVHELQAEREYLLRTVKELRIQVDELLLSKARADRLGEQVARLETDLIKAHAERDAAHRENEDLRERLASVVRENESLSKRVDQLEHELHNMRIHITNGKEGIEVDINDNA
jgi:outer membrane murein-binding lipoprotein Lpp